MSNPELSPHPPIRPPSSGSKALPFILICVAVSVLLAGGLFLYPSPKPEPRAKGPLVIQVSATWEGASALEIEEGLCNPIEKRLAAVEGVTGTRARIADGRLDVEADFDGGTDEIAAVEEVRSVLNELEADLPEDAAPLNLMVLRAPGDRIVTLAMHGDDITPLSLNTCARDLARSIERERGVRRVEVIGSSEQIVRIDVDVERCVRFGLPPTDVLLGVELALTPDMGGADGTPVALRNIVIRVNEDGEPVYLRDLAMVRPEARNPEPVAWSNGRPAVVLRVACRAGADAPLVDTVTPRSIAGLPEGVEIDVWEEDRPGAINVTASWTFTSEPDSTAARRISQALEYRRDGSEILAWAAGGAGRVILRGVENRAARSLLTSRIEAVGGVSLGWVRAPERRPIEICLACDQLDILDSTARELTEHLRDVGGTGAAGNDLSPSRVTLQPIVDQERAARLGLTEAEVLRQLLLQTVGTEIRRAEGPPVLVRFGDEGLDGVADLGSLMLWTAEGATIPLPHVVRIERSSDPEMIRHRNGRRSATIYPPCRKAFLPHHRLAFVREAFDNWTAPGVTVTLVE